MVSPILEALINFCKDKKIIRKKKKFIHPDVIKERFLAGEDVARLSKDIEKSNKVNWSPDEYYQHGGKIWDKDWAKFSEGFDAIASLISLPFNVLHKTIDWIGRRGQGSDAIHRAMGRKEAPSLAAYLFRDKEGNTQIQEEEGYKKLTELIDYYLVTNGLEIHGETHIFKAGSYILQMLFSYGEFLVLGHLLELFSIPNPDINKVADINSKNLKYADLNVRYMRVYRAGKILSKKARSISATINRDLFQSRFDEKTDRFLFYNAYALISSLIPLLSLDLKEQLFSVRHEGQYPGETKEEQFANRDMAVIMKPIFYLPGTITKLTENILATNAEVQEIITRHVRGQEIKQALLNLEDFIKQMIQNTTKVD